MDWAHWAALQAAQGSGAHMLVWVRLLDRIVGERPLLRQRLFRTLAARHAYRAALLTLTPWVRRYGSVLTYTWAAQALAAAVPAPTPVTRQVLAVLQREAQPAPPALAAA